MSCMIKAALVSPNHPEYGTTTIPFPIPRDEYDRTMELLEGLGIGDPLRRDCRVDKLDGQAIALDLIQSGKGTVTPYGVIFDNSMELEPVYDGQHFPLYFYEMPLLNLEVRNEQPDSPVEYLGLPASDKQIERTLLRAGVTDQSAALWDVESGELSEPVALAIDLMREDISSLNGLCRAIEPLDTAQREKLDAVVLLARPKCASEVHQLAENLDQFNFVPKPFNPEADCAITDLGYVAYHGSLALDELMQEDPAEPEIGPMLM